MVESPENSARKQYRPAAVTVAVGDVSPVVLTVTGVEPMLTPPVSHVPVLTRSLGPHRKYVTVPLNELTPVTLMSALSLTSTLASAGAAGIAAVVRAVVPSAATGWGAVEDV